MASRSLIRRTPAIRRAFSLLASAAIAAMPLASIAVAIAPAAPVVAGTPTPPSLGSGFSSYGAIANAGIVNLTVAPATGEPSKPNAVSVTATAGGSALQGASILKSDLSGSPLASTTLVSLHLESLPVSVPLSTIPIQRASAPHTWQELLAPTVLAGIPLVNVTWSQLASLTGAGRPAALDTITMADVDWSGSVLADLPLAAFTFGGANVTDVTIPLQPGEAATDTNADRWCYLLNQAQAGSCPSAASLTGKTLIGIGVEGAPLKNIPLKNIPLKNIDLSASPLKNIPLKNIVLSVSPLKNIPLKNIDLANSPLKNIPLQNIDLTTSPLKNIPLKNIAWAVSPLKNIPLKNIDLTASPLKNIPLKNIDFAAAPLAGIPLKNINLVTSGLGAIPLKNIDFSTAPLKNIPLKNIDLSTSPLKNIPLKNIAATLAPLKNIPLKNIDFSAAPLKNIPLKNIDLTTSGLGALPLDAIPWTMTPLGATNLSQLSFATGPLGSILVSSTANPAAVAGCAAAVPSTCASETLAQAAAPGGDILPGATLADIGTQGFTGIGTLANLLAARTAASTLDPTLGDLRLDLAGTSAPSVTLAALLAAFTPSASVPDPVLGDLRTDLEAGAPTLGDLRLDLVAGLPTTGATLSDLLALLTAAQPDTLLGDIRLDLVTSAPATTVADLVASLSAAQPGVLLGDLSLDTATGVDALVLNAISGFLIDPATFAPYLLGALGTYTDVTGHDITLGELGTWTDNVGADITLGQLAQYLDSSVSLADVLLGIVPPSQFPFENFPISSLGLSAPGRFVIPPPGSFQCGCGVLPGTQPPAGYSTDPLNQLTMNFQAGYYGSDPFTIVALLPPTSGFTSGTVVDASFTPANTTVSTDPDGRVRVTMPYTKSLTSGEFTSLALTYTSPIHLGPQSVTVEVLDSTNAIADTSTVAMATVQDGAEPNTPIEDPFVGPGRVPVLPVNPSGCSGSSANCTGADPTYVDTLATGFISYPGDVDWYQLSNVRAGSRITADLTNLPLDADLVLYGPSGIATSPTLFPSSQVPLPGQLVEDPGLGVGRAADSIAAQSLSDLQLDKGWTNAGNIFVPAMTPLSISAHRGTDPESVGVIAPVTGNYIVAVTGYNGATSNDPYLLRARVFTPKAEATCPSRAFPTTMPPATPAIPTLPAGTNAVFLTDPGRLVATYGQAAADAIALSLANHVAYLQSKPQLGIIPAIVPVDAYPGVRPAYDTWDANPCSVSAANAVVTQITGVLQGIQAANPGLAYVTIVGGDDILPMGRVPDLTRVSNESGYASTFGATFNPLSAAEAASDTLTDDVYGDTSPTSMGNGSSLFIPRLAVGRLVEAPADIEAQLASFGTNKGVLDTSTALVAGYDFLADGSQAVASRLSVGGRSVDSALIDQPNPTAPWTAAQLLAKLFPTGGSTPMIDSINAHYDHTALLPSAGNAGTNSQLETAADIASRSTGGQLAGHLLFTMGCHAGLSVPDAYITGTDPASATLRADWAQTLSAAGVSVYVANTGYGIGDTSSVAYSERLMALYAKLLDGSLTAGQALVYAKQAYYGSLGAVGVYDTKILQQTAFYGLPFWRVSTSPTATPPAPPTAPSLPGTLATDPVTGLQALAVTQTPTFAAVTTSRGTYWTATGANAEDPQVTQYQPLQPKTAISVVTTGQTAHGALVTSLVSQDVPGVTPVLDTPTVDLGASSPEVRSAGSAWPARLATITTSQAPYGRAQSLVLVPGQFTGSTVDGTGVQRLFTTVGTQVLYSPDATTDFNPPAIARTSGSALPSGSIDFAVTTTDAEGPVKRVVIGYHDFDGSWKFKDLTRGTADPTSWTANAPVSRAVTSADAVEYFVQVVDAAGNVATASGKAAGFDARITDVTPPTITGAVTPAPNAAGWSNAASATVTFTCTDSGSGIVAGTCPAPVVVTAEGATAVSGTVSDRAGNTSTTSVTVQLDRTAPSISATVTPAPNAAGWSNGPSATVTFTCSDAGSGLDPTTPCPAPVTVTAEGVNTVNGTVSDLAGNVGTAAATVRLDRTAPTISAAVTPLPNPAGWNKGASATVSFTCADAGSGLAPGACPAPAIVTTEGVSAVSGTVIDQAGNSATISATVRLDRTAPTITTAVAPPPNAAGWSNAASEIVTFTCSDALSGIDPATACPAPSTVTAEGVTAVSGSVADLAGNLATATATVRLDRTPPTITAKITPTLNAAGWEDDASEKVTFTCADSGSGIATGACPAPIIVTAEGVTPVTGTVSDVAGNQASVTVTVRLDRTAPVVTLSGIPTAPACSTTDALSGVATSAILLSATVRVFGIPVTTVTCLGASDRAGNFAAPVIRSFVAPIRFSGFQSPIYGPPAVNTGTAGRSYPVRFQLRDAGGSFISALAAVTSTTSQSVSCSTFTGSSYALPAGSTAASNLAYVTSANQYVDTWKTPTIVGCYVLKVALADGSSYSANFNLK